MKKLLIIILYLTFIFCLIGCSDEDNQEKQSNTNVRTISVVGTVNGQEIGGKSFKVLSSWNTDVDVSEKNSFNVNISNYSSEILMLIDENEALRALTISIPNENYRLRFDAEATAFSLLMMTPGILSLTPEESLNRLNELHQTNEFLIFVNYLRNNLLNQSLSEIISNTEYSNLLDLCIKEWKSKNNYTTNSKIANNLQKFSANIIDDHQRSHVKVALKNQSWRFGNVYRKVIKSDNETYQYESFYSDGSSFPGAVPISWSCYFAENCGGPTVEFDYIDFSCATKIQKVEYIISGWGANQGETLPTSLQEIDQIAIPERTFMSIFVYITLPLIDLFIGNVHTHSEIVETGKHFYEMIQTEQEFQEAVSLFENASNQEQKIKAITNIVRVVAIDIISNEDKFWDKLGIPGLTDSFIRWLTFIFNNSFTYTNLYMVTVSWENVPRISKVVIDNPWADDPCIDNNPPAPVTDLKVLNVTGNTVHLSWTSTGDDFFTGIASFNDIRYSKDKSTLLEWENAIDPIGEPPPIDPENEQSVIIGNLQPNTTYWFAIKIGDEIPNWSSISNIVSATTNNSYKWNIKYGVNQCQFKKFQCSPSGCICPPESTIYCFCPSRNLNIWGVDIERTGNNINGYKEIINANIGSFFMKNGQISLNGIINNDILTLTMTLTGYVKDLFLDDELNTIGYLNCTFNSSNHIVNNEITNGSFTFEIEVTHLEDSCYKLTYIEKGEGTVIIENQNYKSANKKITHKKSSLKSNQYASSNYPQSFKNYKKKNFKQISQNDTLIYSIDGFIQCDNNNNKKCDSYNDRYALLLQSGKIFERIQLDEKGGYSFMGLDNKPFNLLIKYRNFNEHLSYKNVSGCINNNSSVTKGKVMIIQPGNVYPIHELNEEGCFSYNNIDKREPYTILISSDRKIINRN